jgi:hypothetical protein
MRQGHPDEILALKPRVRQNTDSEVLRREIEQLRLDRARLDYILQIFGYTRADIDAIKEQK